MPSGNRMPRVLGMLASALVILALGSLGLAAYIYGISRDLPEVGQSSVEFDAERTSFVYASDGTLLAEWHAEQDRTVVALSEIPRSLRDAVVAIEDERFYEHSGVDTRSILRALRANVEEGQVTQGGSTITQQLVKLLFTDGERTIGRKVREALLAYELEARTDKDKVLEAYLNAVYFGHGAYGAESAAQRYFGKSVSDLDLEESALLAAVIRGPSVYSPVEAPERALARRNIVLAKMRSLGFITEAEERAASASAIELASPSDAAPVAPYFVEYVKQQLIAEFGADAVFKGGLRVHTTLDPSLQRAAEEAVSSHLGGEGDPETALVALRHSDGRILAMVGGRDFGADQFNLAAQGKRQPGSAFKTFVLVTALAQGVRPEEVWQATPYEVAVKDGTWRVQNYGGASTASQMTLNAATRWSVNTVYARLIMQVGADEVAEMARRMGIETPVDPNPAIALGGLTVGVSPLEMASAYGTIASGGLRAEPVAIVRVLDDAGDTLFENENDPERVLEPDVAAVTSLMLHDVVENGTGQEAKLDVWAAGKTGTTQSHRDAWFVGYAGDVSCAVWVGFKEAQVAMDDVKGIAVTGGSFPARIWRQFMAVASTHAVRAQSTDTREAAPEEVVLTRICEGTMRRANQRCPKTVDLYLSPGLVPGESCPTH